MFFEALTKGRYSSLVIGTSQWVQKVFILDIESYNFSSRFGLVYISTVYIFVHDALIFSAHLLSRCIKMGKMD